ncbi:MAG TPA: hypothetical protein VMG10_14380 [Gemmataceae bacterium]|nr:hypothetical protein [Gemmataceae bacterium]
MQTKRLSDPAIWETLLRLVNGRSPVSADYRRDFAWRELVCTPYEGCYGVAGWILCVNGSPPRATVLFDAPRYDRLVHLVFYHASRCRNVSLDSEAGRSLARFHEEHLKDEQEPMTFYPEIGP